MKLTWHHWTLWALMLGGWLFLREKIDIDYRGHMPGWMFWPGMIGIAGIVYRTSRMDLQAVLKSLLLRARTPPSTPYLDQERTVETRLPESPIWPVIFVVFFIIAVISALVLVPLLN